MSRASYVSNHLAVSRHVCLPNVFMCVGMQAWALPGRAAAVHAVRVRARWRAVFASPAGWPVCAVYDAAVYSPFSGVVIHPDVGILCFVFFWMWVPGVSCFIKGVSLFGRGM